MASAQTLLHAQPLGLQIKRVGRSSAPCIAPKLGLNSFIGTCIPSSPVSRIISQRSSRSIVNSVKHNAPWESKPPARYDLVLYSHLLSALGIN